MAMITIAIFNIHYKLSNSSIRLIRLFFVVPAEFLALVYISVRLIRHRLIRQFAQFVTSFYP